MRTLLRCEHWVIQKFRFDNVTNNLFWVVGVLLPFVIGVIIWLLTLHDQPDRNFIVTRDPSLSGEVAEIYYQENQFVFRPLTKHLLLNFAPVTRPTPLAEQDQLVIGHTIFQVRDLDGWTPHLRTIGYYATDRDLSEGVSVGRSIHPEELNQWEVNEIIVKDNTFEPVHFMLWPLQDRQYRLRSLGAKGVDVPAETSTEDEAPEWMHVTDEATIQAGQRIKIGASVFELVYIESQEALALKILRGVRPAYSLSREARNVIGGLTMIPKKYIPDYLVDEEFLEYVRQAIEHGLFYLDDPATRQGDPQIYVKGFDTLGQLERTAFAQLSPKQIFLLHKIFRFREQEGAPLRWRRPFNRDAEDSYRFYPDQIENFILDERTNQVKNIYQYAARLTNPHTIAEELATTRGEIYDRDRYSHARLLAYLDPQASPVTELLLIPSAPPESILTFNTAETEPDNLIYVAGGYRFSDGSSVMHTGEDVRFLSNDQETVLQDGDRLTVGQYTFRYAAPGHGLLAENVPGATTPRRYYPLGNRLAHLVGYSFAKNQFKGNLEEIFDEVLLGREKEPPWWSLKRTREQTPGNNLILTLDDDLQRIVYAELRQKLSELNTRYNANAFTGAAIMINAEGEILASATSPSYNPNDLQSILQALKESSEDHWNSSYINRATQKSYPPGSTMKVIMSTIALDNKAQFLWDTGDGEYLIKDESRTFACTGYLSSFRGVSFGRYGIPDFGGASHGVLTLDTALTKSCNNTFAFLALNAGWERIQDYAERYGFNQQFDFLPYEMFKDDIQLVSRIDRDLRDPLTSLQSQVPTPEGGSLRLPQVARMGIGQWEILATPLQMAMVAMTVGNLGLRPYPHLVKGIEDLATHETRYFPYPAQQQVFAAPIFQELTPMMQHVVQRGSGVRMARSNIRYYSLKDHVAGKTGTAEVEDPQGRTYNVVWFISFVPVEDPQLALAVVIERGPIISGEAVEIARGIWEKAVLLYPDIFQQRPETSPN
ncbi:hypothetical protein GF339_13920 [candidate division KSB3 bacterium]|uniref:Penicillin-binding protein transpeptidase domain-containing protein n=1 Tax=candidate division KSB3 bacterium TaxID=2044937 RepID=A0A9D5Q6S7_9BACT|nr:hypothetical protein [candidate division KSB3 bacterium]MBD3325678.1 hypothetical protein [candidate division KSB3 bacterium]